MPTPGPALFLLGGIELRGVPSDQANRLLGQSKVVALLAYLSLSPVGRHQRRDLLVGLLWPELDQAHARATLRKAVHTVRTVLGATILIARGDEELSLAPDALWCDAAVFNALADSGRLAQALELYRGDLMPGFHLPGCGEFGMWLEDQRMAAVERAAAASWALAERLEEDKSFSLAGNWARRAVRYSWSDERVLRRAMKMLERLGDRAGALQLFDSVARRLRSELEAEPSPETVALAATMRAGEPR